MKKEKPIQILDHVYYRDAAISRTYKFRIASNNSQHMIDKNLSVCILSHDTKFLLIELNEKTYDIKEINQRDMSSRVIHLSNQKKISILSCEEVEEECIKKILGKIYNLYGHLS